MVLGKCWRNSVIDKMGRDILVQNSIALRSKRCEFSCMFYAVLFLTALSSFTLMISPVAAQEQKKPLIIQPGAPGNPSRVISAEESLALGQSRYTQHDVSFMQMMIVHHAQAIEMSDLIAARTKHGGLRLMGKRITLSQEGEIEMMRTWLSRRKQALVPIDDHSHHMPQKAEGELSDIPVMNGMLSPKKMGELAATDGVAFIRLYLEGMMMHHRGAIDMVKMLMTNAGSGEDPEVSEFLSSIIVDQSAEILRMNAMLVKLK